MINVFCSLITESFTEKLELVPLPTREPSQADPCVNHGVGLGVDSVTASSADILDGAIQDFRQFAAKTADVKRLETVGHVYVCRLTCGTHTCVDL